MSIFFVFVKMSQSTINYVMTQKELKKVVKQFEDRFEIMTVGKSVLGQNIFAFFKKEKENLPWVLVVGGMHAREHLSTDLICKLIEDCAKLKLCYNICFVPLVNPDGANLCVDGLQNLDEKIKEKLLEINGSQDFSLFKANANGVDLNNNWDANWDKKFSDKTVPSSQGFYGFSPMSEPEVVALEKLTNKLKPFLVISFHLKGQEIYFDFFQDKTRFVRDKKIAKVFARSSGYRIKRTQHISSGGFKDWCVQKLKITALTIELGKNKFPHPYPKSELKRIYKKNRKFFKNIQKSLKIYNKFQNRLTQKCFCA